jgi:quercetin dioxygenase-like cupin family protein
MAIQVLAQAATQVKVVEPGGGRRGALAPGVGVIFKIDGEDTGGALSIVEHPFDVGALVPPHIHTLEDEYSIVLEGEIGFRSNDKEVVLGPGGYIIKPRGEVHAMWNAGSTKARMIEVITPSGFERFFREFVEMTDAGPPDPAEIARLSAHYQLPFARPEWLADVITRYNLTPPPG